MKTKSKSEDVICDSCCKLSNEFAIIKFGTKEEAYCKHCLIKRQISRTANAFTVSFFLTLPILIMIWFYPLWFRITVAVWAFFLLITLLNKFIGEHA